jgi:hypothetical protein
MSKQPTKADKLRDERDAVITKLKRERDDELGTRAEIERGIKELQSRLAKKQASLDALAAESNKTVAELDRKIAAAVAEEKEQQLHEVARSIDADGETPAKWAAFDRLCAEIPNKQSYQLRCMNRQRMMGDKEYVAFGRPYPSVEAWAAAMTG